MVDLVSRLRATATTLDGLLQLIENKTDLTPLSANVREAADEIDRLRKALQLISMDGGVESLFAAKTLAGFALNGMPMARA